MLAQSDLQSPSLPQAHIWQKIDLGDLRPLQETRGAGGRCIYRHREVLEGALEDVQFCRIGQLAVSAGTGPGGRTPKSELPGYTYTHVYVYAYVCVHMYMSWLGELYVGGPVQEHWGMGQGILQPGTNPLPPPGSPTPA